MTITKELNNINSRLEALDDTLGVTLGEVVMLLHEVINRQSDIQNFLWKNYYREERMEVKNG
jgi:tetrahydromethanopterin S-methyltransferase subunit G